MCTLGRALVGSFEAGRKLPVRPIVSVLWPILCLRLVGPRHRSRMSLPGGIPSVHHAWIHFANQPLPPRSVFYLPPKPHEDLYWNFFWFSIEPHGPWLKSDVPTVIGLGVGMSVFMALTCLVLRLFSRARFAQDQARGYGNAHLAPPTSTSTTINHTHTGLWATSLPRFDLLLVSTTVLLYTIREKEGCIRFIDFYLNIISDGKHPPRPNYHRQVSITDSDTAAPTGTWSHLFNEKKKKKTAGEKMTKEMKKKKKKKFIYLV